MNLTAQIFSCTRCGYCCHGDTTVSLTARDQERMITALGKNRETVQQTFWRVTDGCVQMKVVDGHCIFYANGCSVHHGRPWRCAQWPLHPSILTDENNFYTIAESCPGIKKEVGYEKFCEIMRKLMDNSVIQC